MLSLWSIRSNHMAGGRKSVEKAGSFRHFRERAAAIEGGILDAQLLPRAIQPTTFGEIGGRKSSREEALAYIFRKATFHTRSFRKCNHWQISHLGVIIPLADAYYQSRHPEKICANEKLMTLTAYRMKKNLKWIAQKGMLCPAKLYMIKDMRQECWQGF